MKPLNLLIGITGSIAAYKIPEAVRAWKATGVSVRVALTNAAEQFITPLCLEVLSESPVYRSQDHLDTASKMTHIELARWADHILIAPASANFIAKLAHGFCDDLLSTLCLASQAPLWIVPAMNRIMWEAVPTQANVALLKTRGVHFLGPDAGPQACGEVGDGRMVEAAEMIAAITQHTSSLDWIGKKVVITGGPTREAIDPVRYISNHSTGHMAYAIAHAAVLRGATVTLITGPTDLPIPAGVTAIRVNTATEMLTAALAHSIGADLFIGAAAVSDYTPENYIPEKIKKTGPHFQLNLKTNPDIIATIASLSNRPRCVIGFAAETENLEQYAQQKLKAKGLDAIIANKVGTGIGFGDVSHEVFLISLHQPPIYFPKTSKALLAKAILTAIGNAIMGQ